MDSGHHYQATLLYLLKKSASKEYMAVFVIFHQFYHDSPKARDRLGNSDVVEGDIDPGLQ
jgi:hypothetical protein